jgi:hypothetical protein
MFTVVKLGHDRKIASKPVPLVMSLVLLMSNAVSFVQFFATSARPMSVTNGTRDMSRDVTSLQHDDSSATAVSVI